MLSLLTGSTKLPSNEQGILLSEVEEENTKNELFFKQIENWRSIEQIYIAKITQVANNLRDKSHRLTKNTYLKAGVEGVPNQCEKLDKHKPLCVSKQFSKILQVLIDSHQSFLSKINYDIFMVNLENANKLMETIKKLIDESKQQNKEISSKRQQIQKVLAKKDKLKKMKEEQQMCQIFMSDSIDFTLDQKIRKKGKAKQLEKEMHEYDIKIREVTEQYKILLQKQKQSVQKLKQNNKQLNIYKIETLLKARIHLGAYWKNLISQLGQVNDFEVNTCNCYQQYVFKRLSQRQDKLLKRLGEEKSGFVENSLKLINQNIIDQLIQYKKDSAILNRIRRMMETDEVNPTETDELCRLVKLIKKIIDQQEQVVNQCMTFFRGIINKSSKHRLNFVFVMQSFRLNNKFEINPAHIYAWHCLISQFLQACYEHRDSFSLKQIMILLVTYYVTHTDQKGEVSKLYIIHFFKRNSLWKQIQYWDSILLECIYLEKKNTINAMIVGSFGNLHRKKELLEAERAAILNQMLIVVRNMVIFEFTQKQVKTFATRFIKLLKQDQKFQKDINNTIEEAVKEETQLNNEQKEQIKQFYKRNFDKDHSMKLYNVPQNVRKSYIA